MKASVGKCLLALALLCALSGRAALATTWAPGEVVCPVCKTKNRFLQVMSYGSYIYQWDSKFQYIFWPLTDSPVLYSCKKCHLTAYMWDFEKVPREKHAAVLKRLEGVALEPRAVRRGDPEDDGYRNVVYTTIPMSQRLAAAERVYQELGRDEQFWCEFYRVVGYHLEAEKNQAGADEARRKALALAEKMLADEANAGTRKELLYISGAMRHFLHDDARALKDFDAALALNYHDPKLDDERNGNLNAFLTDLLRQYIQMLRKPAPEPNPSKSGAAQGFGRDALRRDDARAY